MKFANIFPRRIAKGEMGAMRRASRVSLVLLAGEGWMQHQRAGEEKGDPEQAGAVAADSVGGRIEDEAERT